MDKGEYTSKAQALLDDTSTYKVLNKDPTPQLKTKLINLLKGIKQSGGLSAHKYKQLYPTSAIPPKFYGLPKIHETGTPLRPIVSSRGSITYGVVKELSHIIKPLASHHTTSKTLNTSSINYKTKSYHQGKSSHPLMSKPCLLQFQSNPPYKLSKTGYNRTHPSHKGLSCLSHKSPPCWSSVSPTPTSSSRVSIMNKSKVQLWDPLSALS